MPPDWLTTLNAWSALPFALLASIIAIWQIRQAVGQAQQAKEAADNAVTAAEAAQMAAETAARKINSNLLLVVLPQLAQIESDLEWAIEWAARPTGDRGAVVHYLGAWRWQASQARGHLDPNDDNEDILESLQASIAVAADTKIALQDSSADVVRRTRAAMKSIAKVTGMLGEMTMKNVVEGTANNGV